MLALVGAKIVAHPERKVLFIVYNIFPPTRDVWGLSIHHSDKEHTNTWMNSKVYMWK